MTIRICGSSLIISIILPVIPDIYPDIFPAIPTSKAPPRCSGVFESLINALSKTRKWKRSFFRSVHSSEYSAPIFLHSSHIFLMPCPQFSMNPALYSPLFLPDNIGVHDLRDISCMRVAIPQRAGAVNILRIHAVSYILRQ